MLPDNFFGFEMNCMAVELIQWLRFFILAFILYHFCMANDYKIIRWLEKICFS